MGTHYNKTDNSRRNETAARRSAQAGGVRKQKKSKKFMSGKRGFFVSLIAIIAVVVILLLSPIFSISEIKIDSVSLYEQENIAAAFQEYQGKNGFLSLFKNVSFSNLDDIFKLCYGNKEKSMLFDFPLLKNVTVKYKLPNTLLIEIEERTPIMIVESYGMYLHLDSEGYLLGAYAQSDNTEMPIIKGVGITEYKIGTSVAGGKNRTIDEAIKICTIMKQLSMLSYIDIIDVSDYNNVWMYCAPSLSIKFGSAEDIGRKLSYLKGIIDNGHDGNSNGTLDLSTGGNPIFKGNDSVPEDTPQSSPTPGQ